jgi:hypothetical protein
MMVSRNPSTSSGQGGRLKLKGIQEPESRNLEKTFIKMAQYGGSTPGAEILFF